MEPKSESFINRVFLGQQLPVTNIEGRSLWLSLFDQELCIIKKKEYKKAFVDAERILLFIPNDTSQLMNAGVYLAHRQKKMNKAIVYINQYLDAGGKTQMHSFNYMPSMLKKRLWTRH